MFVCQFHWKKGDNSLKGSFPQELSFSLLYGLKILNFQMCQEVEEEWDLSKFSKCTVWSFVSLKRAKCLCAKGVGFSSHDPIGQWGGRMGMERWDLYNSLYKIQTYELFYFIFLQSHSIYKIIRGFIKIYIAWRRVSWIWWWLGSCWKISVIERHPDIRAFS